MLTILWKVNRQIHSANTQIHAEITVSLYIQHTQAILINIKTCTNTQHAIEHIIDTYLFIEDHQLRADLPRSSQP
jgi:hypothetical protein